MMRPLKIIQALEQMYIKTESGTKQEKQQKKTKTWSLYLPADVLNQLLTSGYYTLILDNYSECAMIIYIPFPLATDM